MGDQTAVILVGPWLARMSEAEFLTFLLGRLSNMPPDTVTMQLVDLNIDIILPLRQEVGDG